MKFGTSRRIVRLHHTASTFSNIEVNYHAGSSYQRSHVAELVHINVLAQSQCFWQFFAHGNLSPAWRHTSPYGLGNTQKIADKSNEYLLLTSFPSLSASAGKLLSAKSMKTLFVSRCSGCVLVLVM